MEILEFIKTHDNILNETLAKLDNNELQPHEYFDFKVPIETSYGNMFTNIIFSMAGRFKELVLEEIYAGCVSDNGFDDLIDKAHFYLLEMEDCRIYMTVYEKDDICIFHYVFKGDTSAREKYRNEIKTMFDDIFGIINDC